MLRSHSPGRGSMGKASPPPTSGSSSAPTTAASPTRAHHFQSLTPVKPLADLSESEVVGWLDNISLSCASKPDLVKDQLSEVVKVICSLLRGRIGFSHKVQLSGAQYLNEIDQTPRNPMFAALFQTITSLSKLAGSTTHLPHTSELLLALMALAAVAPQYSQSAYIAAKAVLRQAGNALFSADAYTPQLHRWLKEALRRGGEQKGDGERSSNDDFASQCAFEERKIAFHCLDRMVRGDVTLVVAVGQTTQGGVGADAPASHTAELKFTTMVLELLSIVETEVVASFEGHEKKTGENGDEAKKDGAETTPTIPMSYYETVATDFTNRVYKAQISKQSDMLPVQSAAKSPVSMSNRRQLTSHSQSGSPLGSTGGGGGRPVAESARPSFASMGSRAGSFQQQRSQMGSRADLAAARHGSPNRGGTTGNVQQVKIGTKKITLTDTLLRSPGSPSAAPPLSDTDYWTIDEAQSKAVAAMALIDDWPKKLVVTAPKVVQTIASYKEGREAEMSLLSAEVARLQTNNASLADGIRTQRRVLEMLSTPAGKVGEAEEAQLTELLATMQLRVASLDSELERKKQEQAKEMSALHQALHQELCASHATHKRLVAEYHGNQKVDGENSGVKEFSLSQVRGTAAPAFGESEFVSPSVSTRHRR